MSPNCAVSSLPFKHQASPSIEMSSFSEAHICQCLSRIATTRRNYPVTISGNRRKTGGQFVDSVLALADGLIELGLKSGDVVAISAFNSDWYLEWLLAVAFVGGIAAPLNYRWSIDEARFAITTVQPVMLVTDGSCHGWFSKLQFNEIPSLRWNVSLGSTSSNFEKSSHDLTAEELKKHPIKLQPSNYSKAREGAVIICFTSGTTGRPKGVTITHLALIVQSLAKIAIVGYGEDDVYLHTAPLCHIGGLSSALTMLMLGACHIILPKFEVKSAVEAVELYSVTSLITVPTMMADLVALVRKMPDWKGRESIKKILNGGGSLPKALIKDASKFFPRAMLVSAYGMTETCSSMTFITLNDPKCGTCKQACMNSQLSSVPQQQRGVCVGKAAPHIEMKVSYDGSFPVGRILTRGPHVMLRYWGQTPSPSEPSTCNTEVWFDSGDIGSIDDFGNLWLVGRTNGRIKSGGENVYPEEVEKILSQHPGVEGIVVVGVPDVRMAEMVVACVRPRENGNWSGNISEHPSDGNELRLSAEILRNFCKENRLSGFKIPKKFILWRKPFPVNTMGKIQRDLVRRDAISRLLSSPSKL